MDETGVSSLKTLNDMGFTEVRLRDTLMRATNASGLFGNALSMASDEWKTNTALTQEAEKRYGTTASQLTMLKNKAVDLTRTYGDDLSPAFGDLIDMADGWLDSLSQMDAGQRQTMLSTAAWIAAIGPGIMLIGKLNTTVGAMSTMSIAANSPYFLIPLPEARKTQRWCDLSGRSPCSPRGAFLIGSTSLPDSSLEKAKPVFASTERKGPAAQRSASSSALSRIRSMPKSPLAHASVRSLCTLACVTASPSVLIWALRPHESA
jgi:hypothetical protein